MQHWHFNTTVRGIHFNPVTNYLPSVTTNSYIPFGNEGCSVVSNPNTGDLLFYTDGLVVVDDNNQVMPNGSGLFGNTSSFSSGKTCINPGNCDQFYVFSMNYVTENTVAGNLYYSIVDMTLPGNGTIALPKGDVTGLKNTFVLGDVSEAIEIVQKKGTHDYWILVPKNSTNSIEIFELNSMGIFFSNSYTIPNTMSDMRSIKYCPQNNKIGLMSMIEAEPSLILTFDDLNGTITSTSVIPGTPWGVSTNYWQGTLDCEWSPDGTKLYISKYRWGGIGGGRLYQYDLNNSAVAPTQIYSVSTNNSAVAKGLQTGPDNKIYMLYNDASGLTQFLNVVNDPNLTGIACNFVSNQFDMGASIGGSGDFPTFVYLNNTLPQVPDFLYTFVDSIPSSLYFDPLDPYPDNENDSLFLSIVNVIGGSVQILGDSIEFLNDNIDTNDAKIVLTYCDNHCFPLCDTFTIDLLLLETGDCSELDSVIYDSLIMTIDLGADTSICYGGDLILDADSIGATIIWNTGDSLQSIIVDTSGLYIATANNGYCFVSDSIQVDVLFNDTLNLGADTSICADSLILDAGGTNVSYLWSDGSTNQFLTVDSTGLYWVEVASGICMHSDSIMVTVNNAVLDLGNDTSICAGLNTILDAENVGSSYLWQDGSISQTFSVDSSGIYFVEVNTNGCITQDTIQITILPNADVNLGPDTVICSFPFLLDAQNNGASYLWNDNSTSQTLLVNSPGTYWVTSSILNCSDTDSIIVTNSNLIVDLGIDDTLCLGNVIILQSGNPNASHIWSDNSTGPTLTVSSPGTYFVEVSLNGCIGYDTITFEFQDIQAIIDGNKKDGCIPITAYFNDQSSVNFGYISQWEWQFGDGSTSYNQNPNYTFNSAGNFDVSLLVTSNYGCTSSTTITDFVDANPIAVADFSINPAPAIVDELIDFTNLSEGAEFWEWNFGDNTGSFEQHPMHSYEENGTYTISLIAHNSSGCNDTIWRSIQINEPFLLYVPNVFTPDGLGFNNLWLFYVEGIDIYDFTVTIYNRWGEIIWISHDPFAGWDGTYNGSIVQNGVYVWKMDFGDKTIDKTYHYIGHVTVLK